MSQDNKGELNASMEGVVVVSGNETAPAGNVTAAVGAAAESNNNNNANNALANNQVPLAPMAQTPTPVGAAAAAAPSDGPTTTLTITSTGATITTTAALAAVPDAVDHAVASNENNAVSMTSMQPQKEQDQAREHEQQQQQPPQQTTFVTEVVTTVTAMPQSAGATPAAETNGKGKMDLDAALANFKVLYVLVQLCGLTLIVLMGSWIGVHMGGLAGTDKPSLEFNWHPLLMTIGLIFLYGNSILVYRGFRTVRKKTLKITHASIHMGAFILTVIALKAAFDSHNLAVPPRPNMYSLHSWLGLSAVLIFCMQYVAGFVAYLAPGLRESYKIALMPMHIYFGLFGFVLAIASALMGLTEKAIFSIANYSDLPSSGVVANILGVLFVIFGGLVVYLVTESSYKRKPIPEDTMLLTGSNE